MFVPSEGEEEILEEGELPTHSIPPVHQPVYDVRRYYGDSLGNNVAYTDSPASPEAGDVTGSPRYIIPGSPEQNPEVVCEEDEEEPAAAA